MMSVLLSLFLTLRGSARSRAALQLEVLALRHQLQVLQRSRPPEGAFSSAGQPGHEALALSISTPGARQGRFYDIHARRPGHENWWPRHIRIEEAVAAGRGGGRGG